MEALSAFYVNQLNSKTIYTLIITNSVFFRTFIKLKLLNYKNTSRFKNVKANNQRPNKVVSYVQKYI